MSPFALDQFPQRAPAAAHRRGGRARGRALPRVQRAVCGRALHPGLPGAESTCRGSSMRFASRRPCRSADDLRGEHPRRHVRTRLPGRGAVRGRVRPRARGPGADSRLPHFSGTRRTGRSSTSCRSGKWRAPTGRTVAVVGAGPAGLACAGELAARGHPVTVFEAARRDRRSRPIRDRAVPDRARSASGGTAGARGTRRAVPARCSTSAASTHSPAYDAVFLGVGLGR